MSQSLMQTTSGSLKPEELCERLQHDNSPVMQCRRIIGASLLGIASIGIISLFQTCSIKHLPDPQFGNFNADKTNLSYIAYGYGMPDGPLTLAAHGMNIALAATGPPERAIKRPWLPLLAASLVGMQALVSVKYLFYDMPKKEKAWFPCCITDALTMLATFALSLTEVFFIFRNKRRFAH